MRRAALLAAVLLALAAGGALAWRAGWLWRPAPLATLTRSGVRVDLALERAAGGWVLAATYTPLDADMHLYSTDLPPAGVAGLGRPTRLDIPAGVAVGPAQADRPVLLDAIPELGAATPVYPDGPVTLRVPLADDTALPDAVEARVSYMACSSRGYCLPPVTGAAVTVPLP